MVTSVVSNYLIHISFIVCHRAVLPRYLRVWLCRLAFLHEGCLVALYFLLCAAGFVREYVAVRNVVGCVVDGVDGTLHNACVREAKLFYAQLLRDVRGLYDAHAQLDDGGKTDDNGYNEHAMLQDAMVSTKQDNDDNAKEKHKLRNRARK